jgi:hypothetical protein
MSNFDNLKLPFTAQENMFPDYKGTISLYTEKDDIDNDIYNFKLLGKSTSGVNMYEFSPESQRTVNKIKPSTVITHTELINLINSLPNSEKIKMVELTGDGITKRYVVGEDGIFVIDLNHYYYYNHSGTQDPAFGRRRNKCTVEDDINYLKSL